MITIVCAHQCDVSEIPSKYNLMWHAERMEWNGDKVPQMKLSSR